MVAISILPCEAPSASCRSKKAIVTLSLLCHRSLSTTPWSVVKQHLQHCFCPSRERVRLALCHIWQVWADTNCLRFFIAPITGVSKRWNAVSHVRLPIDLITKGRSYWRPSVFHVALLRGFVLSARLFCVQGSSSGVRLQVLIRTDGKRAVHKSSLQMTLAQFMDALLNSFASCSEPFSAPRGLQMLQVSKLRSKYPVTGGTHRGNILETDL